ncbi:MAG: hypothetical protein J6F30_17525 [Cellulosilyticum sp.]|nr:hypothetical protein [Cellulosilyticum sp.]
MRENSITYVIGDKLPIVKPLPPYSEIVCDFLDELSKRLRRDKNNAQYTDIISLAFWCRKNNIKRLKEQFQAQYAIGRGLVFHITPSNVPINFAFSYFFGLLSGNSNIVRIPQKDYPQIQIICNEINRVLNLEEYKMLKEMTLFVSYGRDDELTEYYSSICDGRIIWGGDKAIKNIRKFSLKERAVEVVFADRYSFALIDIETILRMDDKQRLELAQKFYNDTYLMDQNACSTPHLIIWQGADEEKKKRAQELFWKSIYQIAAQYDLADIKAVDKYTSLCQFAMEADYIKEIQKYDNLLYRIELNYLTEDLSVLRGQYGMFFEYYISQLEELKDKITSKVQTVTYVGINPECIIKFIQECHLTGIDRIVPMGEALNIDVYWDGYDIIGQLIRYIEVR